MNWSSADTEPFRPTHFLDFGVLHLIIERDHQEIQTSQWIIRLHGARDLFVEDLQGFIRRFKPRDQNESEPGPEVFEAALLFAIEELKRCVIGAANQSSIEHDWPAARRINRIASDGVKAA